MRYRGGRDGVETEGPKTEHGGEKPGTTNNVVPFPRDWLGPREELIPFGNSAGYGVERSAAAPGAEAFWGGDSGPLHAVVPAPAPTAAVAGPRFRQRAGQVAVGGLVAAVLAAAVIGRLAGVPAAGSGPAVGSDVAAAGFVDLALLRGAVGAPAIESSKPAVHHAAERRRRPAAHTRHRPATPARTSGTNSTAGASSAATVAAAPATSTSQPASSTESSSAGSQPAATSSTPTQSSVSSHTANVRPGPVGPGAPFGPGQLK
ncbi:MAG: hypothetical protein ACXVE9_04325 [Solirubrobacteraceae bacterium]